MFCNTELIRKIAEYVNANAVVEEFQYVVYIHYDELEPVFCATRDEFLHHCYLMEQFGCFQFCDDASLDLITITALKSKLIVLLYLLGGPRSK